MRNSLLLEDWPRGRRIEILTNVLQCCNAAVRLILHCNTAVDSTGQRLCLHIYGLLCVERLFSPTCANARRLAVERSPAAVCGILVAGRLELQNVLIGITLTINDYQPDAVVWGLFMHGQPHIHTYKHKRVFTQTSRHSNIDTDLTNVFDWKNYCSGT